MTLQDRFDVLKRMPAMSQGHMLATGVVFEHLDARTARVRMPYRPEFLGDIQRQLIHTGVIASMIDSASGFVVLARIPETERIVTLDLRVDYLRPSVAPLDLWCEVECYRMTAQIAFVRADVWQKQREDPVATSLSTFMRIATTGAPT